MFPLRPKRFARLTAALGICCALQTSWAWSAPRPGPAATPKMIGALVGQLRSDHVRWNAQRAMWRLQAIGPPATRSLEKALASTDYQQRQLAAHVLRYFSHHLPSQRLLAVTIEGLQDDALPEESVGRDRLSYTYVWTAREGVEYLLDHATTAERLLRGALETTDRQQRFLCAYVLGMRGRVESIQEAAPILVDHLRDNDIPGDALMAAKALYRFGAAVQPLLRHALAASKDQQQSQVLKLIL
ncbi:MAG: hypothetical protein OER86_13340, partial [Phycisphaerae bacterium]|nr:hypothetical protein [Phycisphaerae bacterium]